jgi:hypothetical protein
MGYNDLAAKHDDKSSCRKPAKRGLYLANPKPRFQTSRLLRPRELHAHARPLMPQAHPDGSNWFWWSTAFDMSTVLLPAPLILIARDGDVLLLIRERHTLISNSLPGHGHKPVLVDMPSDDSVSIR